MSGRNMIFYPMSALGPGCVKRRKSVGTEIHCSERTLCDFLGIGNGYPTHENFVFSVFTQPRALPDLNHHLDGPRSRERRPFISAFLF